jgi:hypothetical protein
MRVNSQMFTGRIRYRVVLFVRSQRVVDEMRVLRLVRLQVIGSKLQQHENAGKKSGEIVSRGACDDDVTCLSFFGVQEESVATNCKQNG